MKHSIKAVPGVVILLYPLLISATREPPTHSIAGVLSSDDPTQDLLHDISHGQRVEFGRDHIDQSLTPFLNQPYLAPEALDLSLGGIPTNYRKTFDGDKDLGAGGQDALADVRGSIKRPSLNWPAEDVEGDGNQIDQPTSKRPDLGLRLSSYSAQKGKEPVSSVGPSPGMTRENVWAEQNHSRRKPPFQVREREQDPKSYQQNITPAGHSIPLRPKHPSSFEGFIVNDAGLAEPSSGAKKMQEARYFGLEDLDDKIWPWISVMHPNGPKVKIDSQAQSLIMDSLIKNIPKDLQRKHSQSRTSNSGDASVPIVDFLLDESMKEFVCLLWTENLKVLHVIENESSDSIRHYAEEQTDLMKWFINFILVHQDFTSQRSIHNDDRGVPSIEEYLFYQLSKAIHSSHHENVFQVIPSFPGGSQSPILVSGKQILLNKFVLQLLGFYYKNINCIKWDHMFKKDKYFVLQVANYGRNWIEPPFLGSDQTQTSVHQSWETALPWKNPMLPTLSRNFSDDDKNLGFKYEKLVEPLGHLVASSKLDIPIKQIPDFEYLDQKTWAWISLYIVKEGAPFQQKKIFQTHPLYLDTQLLPPGNLGL
ncbi:hypothetical protein PTTG_26916 [Puccinia triticina 1-1 BBBD Race 1]|uniref:Uncharacterized protein n=2 Tax=Puccinia triticina TaxID=208348 RepID=A0A180GRX0_PUCT1|nr:uncharacterized protein PtA15_12A303 [Puccinia triticina]OAV94723.1 hypothetical protein PTTG_26916 [Puccinia triticina 1-1 BBBD Race 1]WAQ90314.1 hypothetical protein PtA15_12A303 [Puccinia triticina]